MISSLARSLILALAVQDTISNVDLTMIGWILVLALGVATSAGSGSGLAQRPRRLEPPAAARPSGPSTSSRWVCSG